MSYVYYIVYYYCIRSRGMGYGGVAYKVINGLMERESRIDAASKLISGHYIIQMPNGI